MSDDTSSIWHDYVLAGGSPADAPLRAALERACPDCAADLAAAERDLAVLGVALDPAKPSPGLRSRVLARVAGEAAARAGGIVQVVERPYHRADSPQGGPGSVRSNQSLTSLPGVYRVGRWVVTSALIAVVVLLGAVLVRIEGRTAALDQRIDLLLSGQEHSSERMDDVITRLQRTRNLALAVTERDHRLGVLDRRLRDLQLVLASDQGGRTLELAELSEEMSILASPELTVLPITAQGAVDGALRLFWDRAGQRWMVAGSGISHPGPGRCYELWMQTRDGRLLPSVTFVPDGDGTVRAMTDVPATEEMVGLAITDEPEGGVPVATGTVRFLASFE